MTIKNFVSFAPARPFARTPHALLAAAVVAASAAPAWAIVYRDDVTDATVQGLAKQPQFSGIGTVGGAAGGGTGMAISPNWVLTAKHVVTGGATATFNCANGQSVVGDVFADPNSDLALVHLTTTPLANVAFIQPHDATVSDGNRLVWIAGYGEHGNVSGTYSYDSNVRAGTNLTDHNDGTYLGFTNDDTAPGSTLYESSTGPGDSGGPMYLQDHNTWYVVGVTYGVSGGSPNYFIHTPVQPHAGFITATTGIAVSHADGGTQVTWDNNVATAAVQDGAGTWDTTRTHFQTGGFNFAWDNSLSEAATFGSNKGAAGTVTLGADVIVGGLVFNAATGGTYTIAGGGHNLQLAVAAPVTTNVDAAISATITGGGFNKAGAGTLTLSGVNTFTSTVAVNAGVLTVQNGAALGAGGFSDANSTTVAAGATVQLDGTAADFSTDEHFHINGNGAGGVGALYNRAGDNTITDPIANESDSTVGINAGSTLNLGTPAAGAGQFAQFYVGHVVTFAGGGTFNLYGVGHLAGVVVNGPTVAERFDSRLDDTTALTLNAGTFDLSTHSDTVAAVTLSGGSITGAGGTLTGSSYALQNGSVSANLGGTATVTKSTAGTVTLSGVNSYSGGTLVNAGKLLVDNAGGSGTGTGTVTVQTGGTLGGSGSIGGPVVTASAGSGTANNGRLTPGDAGAGTLTVDNNLTLGNNTFLDFNADLPNVAAGTNGNDLLAVLGTSGANGGLSLGTGLTVNLAAGPNFGIGTYKLIQYTGTLTDHSAGFSGWTLTGVSLGAKSYSFSTTANAGYLDLIISPTAVPEPASLVLLAAGGGFLFKRRRRPVV